MAKSKIIKELVNEEISLTVALRRLYILANDIGNEVVKNWADMELNGYKKDDSLPEYRIFKSCDLQYSGVNMKYKISRQPLQLSWLKQETVDKISTVYITSPLSEIENYTQNKSAIYGTDRTYLAGEVEDLTNGYVQCTSISQIVPAVRFTRIITAISDIALKSLIELEKAYGCLDNLDIGSEKIGKKEKAELFENLGLIISGKTIKISNSNIGNGSNSTTKTTDVEISPKVTVKTEKKSNFISKILKNLFKRK